MTKPTAAATSTLSEMEQLRKRYEDLSTRKTRCETNLDNATNALENLQAQARSEYGTDDLEALQQRLEEMKAKNHELQETYRESLDAIERGLKDVDEAYQAES